MDTPDGIAHGALDHAELATLGLCPQQLLDFSSNINPFGPPVGVRVALAALDPAPYPDRSCHALRLALAERHKCEPAALLPGNGANELIHLLARTLLSPGATSLVVGPTYGEYAHASSLTDAYVVEVCAHEGDQFQLDAEALYVTIARTRPRLTWLCTPNNPTGLDMTPEFVATLAVVCAKHGGLLVVDQSYIELRRSNQASQAAQVGSLPAVIWLHSLTKSYALAGLRLGYLLASPELIAYIRSYQPAWSVGSAAQAAGLAALSAGAFLAESVPQLWAASDELSTGIAGLGLTVRRGALPFMLVQTGDGAATRAALLRRGCVVRDCASFGLPAWVRVAPRRPAENAKLLDAWKEIL